MSSDSSSHTSDTDLRVLRVGKAIRDIIANAVVRGLGDVPRGPVTVTRVDCQRDFRSARVFVSIFQPDEPGDLAAKERAEKVDAILFAFEDAEPELRRLINDQLRMKHIPHLAFVLDTGIEKMMHFSEVLKGVQKPGSSDGAAGE